jgi:hypothetical protein
MTIHVRQRPQLRSIGLVIYEISEFAAELFRITVHHTPPGTSGAELDGGDLAKVGRAYSSHRIALTRSVRLALCRPCIYRRYVVCTGSVSMTHVRGDSNEISPLG